MSDTTVELIRLSLAVSRAQQQTHMENIANYNGAGQSVSVVNFSSVLSELGQMSNEDKQLHCRKITAEWNDWKERYTQSEMKVINLDEEVAKMTLVSGEYQKTVELLNRKLAMMALAMNGGRR